MANHRNLKITSCFLVIIFTCFLLPAFSAPAITSCTPNYIEQGQSTFVTIEGSDLDSSVIGVHGGDVFAVIIPVYNSKGESLNVNLSVSPTAALGRRELFLRNQTGQEASCSIDIRPAGAPTAEYIIPNTAVSGSTFSAQITGMGLINFLAVNGIVASSSQFRINSYQSSIEGTKLNLWITLDPEISPEIYDIFINTIGGQTKVSFKVISNDYDNNSKFDSSFSADPNTPGISVIETDPANRSQIIIKGTMFDLDPTKNTVTLLENSGGTVIGRKVEVVSSDNNQIIVSLPKDIDSNSISFAVSSADGKSSNIKTVDLSSLNSQSTTPSATTGADSNTSNKNNEQPTTTHIDVSTTIASAPQVSAATTTHHDTQHKGENETTSKPNEPLTENKPIETIATTGVEDKNIAQNLQNLTKYLFGSGGGALETKKDSIEPSINGISDPLKVISTIEENKQIKNQAELIMLALSEAKENQELSNTLKKAELLKTKVEELENLLNTEKQKNNPDPRKLVKYQQLLVSANAESKSQTFTLLNNLLKYKPQLKNLLTQKPFDLAAIQPNIPNDSAILQYVPTEEGLIIFVVDNKNLKTRVNKNITKDILNKEVQAYRQLFEKEMDKIKLTGRVTPIVSWKDDKSNTYKKDILPLKEKNVYLYNALIAPVEKDIANKKLIAVIANGWLRYLPFQSLAKPTKDGDLKFLISDKSIVYLDSVIAVSKDSNNPLSSMSTITVFANPDGTLTGANKEAETIKSLFGKTTTSLVQKPFDIPIINQLSKKAEIIHLATHGYLDGKDIESSYLISGKKLEGKKFVQEKLFLKDIYDLNLNNSKLVVLSGCDTGKLGNLLNEPDDIVGSLATAFRVAGANTILASLWKAHDEATKIIMENFYENIKLGLDKAESLRRAELKVKENPKYSHPLFWSLFNLIGDWR